MPNSMFSNLTSASLWCVPCQAEAKAAFRELLATVSGSADQSWEQVLKTIVNDPRWAGMHRQWMGDDWGWLRSTIRLGYIFIQEAHLGKNLGEQALKTFVKDPR